MSPGRNLEIQTRVIGRARAFVGTYGGLSYLGPLCGVPSIGFYSHGSHLVPSHMEIGWRLGRAMGAPLATLDVRQVGMLGALLGHAVGTGVREPSSDVTAASAGSR
jgi:hypothetical protein